MNAYRDRPTWKVAVERRCEAMSKPTPRTWQEWCQVWRRCQRPAEQGRDGRVVCWQHARTRENKYSRPA